ncbi:homoserine O-acetyltransferase [Micromonospora violae]|uniref:Probable acyltransferase n=1 Tax=Micromonospora violae TaxID=1278207 RepID=A0A4Q7UJ34_9ACTN|nr:homoserine O-acetyltransferase [Micromonospora violae]RZT79553.1 homoserine O-acetyltransferase [Micromonospora violae]
MREFIPPATRFITLPDGFTMRRGGVLDGARVAYEAVGRLNEARDNVVLVLTGMSPDAHITAHEEDATPGWWEHMVGPGRPIDTDRWYVICVNALGSCKGSTGPASVDPTTGEPYGMRFPQLSIEDVADAAAILVRALEVDTLACVVGASMGGMSALSLLVRHPGLARNLINISGAVHALPYAIAVRSLQREAIRSDPRWSHGRYRDDALHYPRSGMRLARKLGMMTYRSAREWDQRFGRARLTGNRRSENRPFDPEFRVEGYLQAHADRFAHHFDPNSYLYLSRCIDLFDLGESCGGTQDAALARLSLDAALVIGVETDTLFPLHQQRQIADGLRKGGTEVQFKALESDEGHDAFLVDVARFGPPIAKFLSLIW